jgi:antitoxin CptB
MTGKRSYLATMPSDADLKRLHWRAHHRGTKEADLMIGGFFDAHHSSWDERDCALFGTLLDEQDVDIIAWALGTAIPPRRFAGRIMNALQKLDYIRIAR